MPPRHFLTALSLVLAQASSSAETEEQRAALLIQSEELLSALRPALHHIELGASNLQIPGKVPIGLFADEFEVIDIAG